MSTPAIPRPAARTSITDSPWYWLYLFCTAGLIALVLVGPKYAERQSHIERSGQGRQRAVQNISGQEPTANLSDAEDTRIPLRPLYYVLGILLALAWAKLAWDRVKQTRTKASGSESHSDSS